MTDADQERGDRRRVASHLRADIEAGRYAPGAKLPSYRQLEDRYGVARNTVAAALRVLQAEGLVDVRPNSGAYVRDPSALRSRDIRTELLDLQEQLHKTRRELTVAQKRVTGLLDTVPLSEPDR